MRELKNPETGFIAGLQGEERARYYAWYRKYVWLRRAYWILGAAQIAFLIATFRARWLTPVIVKIWPLALLAFVGSILWVATLDCPRCGQTFQTNNRYEFADECRSCGLTLRQLSSIAKPTDFNSAGGFN